MSLLISEPPLQVLPSLAVKIGLNEAIILQQVHYWLLKSNNIRDGYKWVYNSYSEWNKQFPFFSRSTMRRAFNSLEKQGLLITANYNKAGFDKTKWYRINYEKLVSKRCVQNEQTMCSKWADGDAQNEQTNTNRLPETTTETNNKHSASHSNAPSVSKLEEEFEEVWSKYPNKKGKKQAFNHYKAWRKASVKHTNEYLLERLKVYMTDLQQNSWKHPMNGSTWFNGRFDDELEVDNPTPANKYEQEGYYDDYKDFVRDDGKGDNLLDGVSDDELPF
ncbi:replication protein [Limosilactobacillus reuteri]|uniref:replication protein n=1 Tax=Limosilactobacillus reuteri TaxID=1598 RepID=UPI001CDC40D7|nr:replication protein [Limosilactobacillus reuteri]